MEMGEFEQFVEELATPDLPLACQDILVSENDWRSLFIQHTRQSIEVDRPNTQYFNWRGFKVIADHATNDGSVRCVISPDGIRLMDPAPNRVHVNRPGRTFKSAGLSIPNP